MSSPTARIGTGTLRTSSRALAIAAQPQTETPTPDDEFAWLDELDDKGREALLEEVRAQSQRLTYQTSLSTFVKRAWQEVESRPLVWNWHMETLCGYLQAFYLTRTTTWIAPRLIFNVPPGASKSMLASVLAPAWVWTFDPAHRFLCGTNDEPLATRDARKMRQLVTCDWYQSMWPIQLATDQGEKLYWENTARGFRQSQGFNGKVTGKRGDTILIDDPHDAKQADSSQMRSEVVRSWSEGWSNRLIDPASSGVCVIMQRVHEDDITGHLTQMKGTKWKQVLIPMRYEQQEYDAGEDIGRPELNDPRTKIGELFFPERFPESSVDDMERELGPYSTAAQHQQLPAPRGGGELLLEWFVRYNPPSERSEHKPGYYYILVDPAGERKQGQKGRKDRTAMGVIECREDGNIYVVDAVYDRVGLDDRIAQLFAWHVRYKPRVVAYESYGKDSDIAAIRSAQEREHYRFHVEGVGGALAKEDRIRRLIPRLANHEIYFPTSLVRPMSDGTNVCIIDLVLEQEVKSFPRAKADDFLDMLSRLEDLKEKGLLKFPVANARMPRTIPRTHGGSSWMSH